MILIHTNDDNNNNTYTNNDEYVDSLLHNPNMQW